MRGKRWAMLTNRHDVPGMIVMQMSATITDKFIFKYIPTNIANN